MDFSLVFVGMGEAFNTMHTTVIYVVLKHHVVGGFWVDVKAHVVGIFFDVKLDHTVYDGHLGYGVN